MQSPNDIVINRNADTTVSFIFRDEAGTPIDVTAYSVLAELRTNFRSTAVVDSLTTDNGRAVIDSSEPNVVKLSFPKSVVMTYVKRRYLYDMVLLKDGTTTKAAYGVVVVNPGFAGT